MDPMEEIRVAQASRLVDEDGHGVTLEVAPGLTSDEIDEVAAEVGAPLPRELRVLLEQTAGISGTLETIDFSGRSLDFGLEEVLPSALPIAHDGFGNHWVLDLTPEETDVAPVLFACHDAPVLLYQSPALGDFLHETFRMYVPPHSSLVDDVHEDKPFQVWRTNPGVLDHAAAMAGDEELRAFATSLDERFQFVDLREPEIGMGFSWGRFGPRTELRRHGYTRLFAYARPVKKPGRLSRLFGREPNA